MTEANFNLLDNHIGYGSSNPKFIIMGLEEGVAGIENTSKKEDSDDVKNLKEKKNKTTIEANYNQRTIILSRSRGNLLDLEKYHSKHPSPQERKWFIGRGKPQRTWQWYCKLLVGLKNNGVWENDKLLDYQLKNLGRENSDHAILEFFPLPRPKNGDWYNCMNIPSMEITGKKNYLRRMITKNRSSLLNDIIKKGCVEIIIIHGSLEKNKLKSSHKKIADHFKLTESKEHQIGQKNNGNIYALEYYVMNGNERENLKIFFTPFLGNGAITDEALKNLIGIINQ